MFADKAGIMDMRFYIYIVNKSLYRVPCTLYDEQCAQGMLICALCNVDIQCMMFGVRHIVQRVYG